MAVSGNMSCWKTVCLGGALFAATAMAATAQTFTTLAYFTDGTTVDSSLIQGRDGNFYGTSNNGGAGGYGTVFKVTPSGTLTTLYTFCSKTNCADGSYPSGGLALGPDGNFYGTAQNGGANAMGVVFKITPSGTYTLLHSFSGSDGSGPDAGLVLASDRNFYGTTGSGGSGCTSYGCGEGTVFKMTTAGALTMLHSFDGSDGSGPSAPLIQGSDGSLYGTTVSGGAYSSYDCPGGCGTVFKVTTGGTFTLLHSFDFSDGNRIFAPLAQDSNGAFYGTASEGGDVGFYGCSVGCGTVFKISSGGTFAIVHKYAQNDDPGAPYGFVLASDGNIYGDSDAVWKLIPPTTFTTVYTFSDASFAATAVLQGTDGLFYGTEYWEYPSCAIYSLDVGLSPAVAFVIPSGKVGQTAEILGQGLTGTSAVTFNGVAAESFSVVSDTYLTAVVPSGATTGSVVVTTPGGALTSNVSFRISK
jgi:uncharacterized repeat protein (TIGR03803 family)